MPPPRRAKGTSSHSLSATSSDLSSCLSLPDIIDHFDLYPDIHPDEIMPAAREEVDILLNRAMILRPEPDENFGVWDFETPFRRMHRSSRNGIGHHLAYIDRFKKGWQLDPQEKMGFPEAWFAEEPKIVLSNNEPWLTNKYDRDKVTRTRMSFYLEPISEHLRKMTYDELLRRHFAPKDEDPELFLLPDFLLATRPRNPKVLQYGEVRPRPFVPEDVPRLERHLDLVNLPMGEYNVELMMQKYFSGIPGCWLVINPENYWLEPWGCLPKGNTPIDFAVVVNTVRPVGDQEVELARKMKISWSNPAVLVAMKGPERWPEFTSHRPRIPDPYWDEADEEPRLHWCLEELAYAVQPSLEALVITNMLKREEQLDNPDVLRGEDLQLEEDAIVFGLLYDYSKLYIVAHMAVIPYGDRATMETWVEYRSVVVDTLDFLRPPDSKTDDRYCLVGRAKMGHALMCVERHAFHLAAHYECRPSSPARAPTRTSTTIYKGREHHLNPEGSTAFNDQIDFAVEDLEDDQIEEERAKAMADPTKTAAIEAEWRRRIRRKVKRRVKKWMRRNLRMMKANGETWEIA